MNDLMVFSNDEFGEVRTVVINGKLMFCGKDVASALGYANPNKAVNDHCRAITKWSTPISGKMQDINYISEGDIYRLAVKSKLPSAEKFESWVFDEVIPSIRATGSYSNSYESHEQAKIEIGLIDVVSSVLHLNDISKVQLMKNVLINHNLPTYILPEYAESKGVMKSASQLLKENKIEMSAVKFNKLMKEKGFMKESFRDSSSGKQKRFNTLTNDKYGQNQVNVNNPKETHPMYYEDKFLELYKLITE